MANIVLQREFYKIIQGLRNTMQKRTYCTNSKDTNSKDATQDKSSNLPVLEDQKQASDEVSKLKSQLYEKQLTIVGLCDKLEKQYAINKALSATQSTNKDLLKVVEGIYSTNKELNAKVENVHSTNKEFNALMENIQSTNKDLNVLLEGIHSSNKELNAIVEDIRSSNKDLYAKFEDLSLENKVLTEVIKRMLSNIASH